MTTVRVRRVYEQRTQDDGTRVLVDRIWPRGLTKADADLDEWCKQVAPSSALRQWYRHDPARPRCGATLTLLTATKHLEISQAAMLADLLSN